MVLPSLSEGNLKILASFLGARNDWLAQKFFEASLEVENNTFSFTTPRTRTLQTSFLTLF
jgi:hypothetical protein